MSQGHAYNFHFPFVELKQHTSITQDFTLEVSFELKQHTSITHDFISQVKPHNFQVMELHLRMVRMIIVLLSAGLISVTCEPEPVDNNNNESSHSELEKQVPAAIQLSYDTGEGNDRAFRHEERIPDGGVKGSYGYHDENGNLVVRHYIADKNGYRIVKEERHPLSSRKETEFSDKFERNDQIYEPNTANYSSIFYGSDLHDTPESTNQRNDLHNANHSPDSTNFRYDLNDRKLSRNTPEVTNSRNDFYDKKLPPNIPVSINKEASSFHDNTQLYDGYYPIQQEPRPRDELHDQLSRRLNNDGKFQSPDYNRGGDIFNDDYYPIQQEPKPRDELHDQLSRRLNNDGKFQSPDYNRAGDIFNDGYQQPFPGQLSLKNPQQQFLDFANNYYPLDITYDRITPVNGFHSYHPFGNNENTYFKDFRNDNQFDFNRNYNPKYGGNYNGFRSYILKHPFNTQGGHPQLRPTATNQNVPEDVPKGTIVGVKLDSGKVVPLYKNYILSSLQRKPAPFEPFPAYPPPQEGRRSHQRPNIFPLSLTPINLQPERSESFLSDQPLFHNDFLYKINKDNNVLATTRLRKPLQTNFKPSSFDYYFPQAPSLSNDSKKISFRPSVYGNHHSFPPQLGFGNIYEK